MKVAVLTTDTSHHAFFVRELRSFTGDLIVFCETAKAVNPPFPTRHPFEEARDEYEWQRWFNGMRTEISALAPTRRFASINEHTCVEALAAFEPDLIISFGTGILQLPAISVCPDRIVNLHGGDPEHYRGLDTHLWAIYHGDYKGLITTLHRLDARLDNGEIVLQLPVSVKPQMPLHALRKANTEQCVRLAISAIEMLGRGGALISRPQRVRGRYYSAMPTVLKEICHAKFHAYTAKLEHASC